MKTHLTPRRILPVLMCLGLVLGGAGPIDFTRSASAAPSKDKIKLRKAKKDLRKQKALVRQLRGQLAAALAQAPKPPQLEMVMVPAGNLAENPADAGNTSEASVYGAVPYDFSIGKYEVSLDEYAAFLNAVAATDTHDLYNASMGTDDNIKGITQNGSAGSFTYTVIGSGKRPVTYVSWFDAARFCNWLHNGCPTGLQDATTTERGAYTLDGATSGGLDIMRNPGAKYWIPSEHEWYKASYHQPQSLGGPADHYWDYPTRRDVPNTPGNDIGPAENQANFRTPDGNYSVTESSSYSGSQNYLTDGGSYPGSASFHGTFDQAGNVWEWNDAVISGSFRGLRGGSWFGSEGGLRSSSRGSDDPVGEFDSIGFRVASP